MQPIHGLATTRRPIDCASPTVKRVAHSETLTSSRADRDRSMSSRTEPASFTAEEIADAGYVGPYTEPAYDAATEQLLWVDGAYVIEALPPPIPTPRWVDFSAIVMSLPAINVSAT